MLVLALLSIIGLAFVAQVGEHLDIGGRVSKPVTLDLPDVTSQLEASEHTAVSGPPSKVDEAPQSRWETVTTRVRSGENLALIFNQNGFSATDLHYITTSKPWGAKLKNIFPGNEIVFHADENNQLMRFTYSKGPLERLEFTREHEGFSGIKLTFEPERVLTYRHGKIINSLFIASQRAGLSDALTMRLAQIFQWDIDFVLDIRPEDAFFLLYEELYFNGELIGDGEILAAEFINQGEGFRAIQYTPSDRPGRPDYYAPNGQSMRKAFLRAPVEFSRISSNFNLRRVHPLFKTVRPHRGIDYAAPKGTPIVAAGDGKVSIASRTKPNGNYVVLNHGEQFVTKYLHLSKFGRNIKSGARVKQGQIIGYVGATGWATAPHLHYEFLVNGVHRNPRTVSLPNAAPIARDEMPFFKAQTQQYAALLDNYKSQISVVTR